MSDDDLWRDTPAGHGSCQCGAVRYSFTAGPTRATMCHCRMCQRAVAGPFATFLEVPKDRITWQGEAKKFASSNIAARGFCPSCGTPMCFEFKDSATIEVAAGTLTPDFPYEPLCQHGIESRRDWLDGMNDTATRETGATGVLANQTHENDGA